MRTSDPTLLKLTRAMWLAVISFLLLVLTFAWYVRAEKSIDVANERRLQLLELAEELRRTSHALTAMARTYVATGNPLYKQRFDLIVAVRDGKQPQPARYLEDSWMFGEDGGQVMPAASHAAPLLDKVRRAVSARAFGKLERAKTQSDNLTRIELEAMRLAGKGADGVDGAASRRQALELVFGPAYQQAKVGIMAPIEEFRELLERETNDSVAQAVAKAYRLRLLVIALSVLSLLMLLHIRLTLTAILGGSVEALHTAIVRLGGGDAPPVADGRRVARHESILDWVRQTQQRLDQIEAQRRRAEQQLVEYAAALEAKNLELKNLSRRDALTGLHNRMAANEQLRKEFTLMQRTGNVYGLLFLDIDHFKQINDTYGHAVGDQVLKAIAVILENQLRKTDFVARFGGEEFIVLLPDTAIEGVVTKAEELCASVMAHDFPEVGRVTVSIGVAQGRPQDSDELDAVRRADELLYAAKRNGRNRVEA